MNSDLIRFKDEVKAWCRSYASSFPQMSRKDLEQEVWVKLCIKNRKTPIKDDFIHRVIEQAIIDVWRSTYRAKTRIPRTLFLFMGPGDASSRISALYELFNPAPRNLESFIELADTVSRLVDRLTSDERFLFSGLVEGFFVTELAQMPRSVWMVDWETPRARYVQASKIRESLRSKTRRFLDGDTDRSSELSCTR